MGTPKGINMSVVERGMTPTELKTILDALIARDADVFLVPSKVGNLNIVKDNHIVGRIEFRNDLGFTGAERLIF